MKDKKTETKPDTSYNFTELEERKQYLELIRDILALEHEIWYFQNVSKDAHISTEESDRESV